MQLTTYKFRVKDKTTGKKLVKASHAVNFVWNYCNEVNYDRWTKFRKTYTGYDLCALTAGCSNDLEINSTTVQCVAKQYDQSRKQHKRVKLNWRSSKRSLGWIPFSKRGVQIDGSTITYMKQKYRFWLSRPIEGILKCGSFTQDSQGNWYINLVLEVADSGKIKTGKAVGIDLGLKTLITCSDGTELTRENLTRKYEHQLAVAQRARKKHRVTAIHTKIRNKRKDWNHKVSRQLVQKYDYIAVGNVNSAKLKKTRMAKSVSDAGWSSFRTMLVYKAITLGVVVKVVNEIYSTVTCSSCNTRSGPKGLSDLGVRTWVCSECGSYHQRDVNAAQNILLRSLQGVEG